MTSREGIEAHHLLMIHLFVIYIDRLNLNSLLK